MSAPHKRVAIKRAYEPAAATDGRRVLVDRLWPRGIRKEDAAIDDWAKDAAPSAALRKWFGHDPARWAEFRRRYRSELTGNPSLVELSKWAKEKPLTLVYSARDDQHNQAVVLREYLLSGEID